MGSDREQVERVLMENLRHHAGRLRELLGKVSGSKIYDRFIYKLYTSSFKAYHLQESTEQIVAALTGIAPEGAPLNPMFLQIVKAGTGHEFSVAHNDHWSEHAAPIVTAFLHAKYFLEMAVQCAQSTEIGLEFDSGSAWQAICTLYGI